MEVAQSLLLLGETEETIEIETGVAVQTDLASADLLDIQRQPDDLQRLNNETYAESNTLQQGVPA